MFEQIAPGLGDGQGDPLGGPGDPGANLIVEDVTNGLYPTVQSKQVFYVRGQVASRAKAEVGPAAIKVEVVEGSKVLASGTGWAGTQATPEKLYNLTDAASLTDLVKTERTEARAIPPGGTQPFVVVLMDFPDDLASHTLRVTAGVGTEVAQK